MNSYGELLSHPKWQKRRLEKMESAKWRCEICGDGEESLNVHHKAYLKYDGPSGNGQLRDPWDYASCELECLCKTCHTLRHLSASKVATFCLKTGYVRENIRFRLDDFLLRELTRQVRNMRMGDPKMTPLLNLMLKARTQIREVREFIRAELETIATNPDPTSQAAGDRVKG